MPTLHPPAFASHDLLPHAHGGVPRRCARGSGKRVPSQEPGWRADVSARGEQDRGQLLLHPGLLERAPPAHPDWPPCEGQQDPQEAGSGSQLPRGTHSRLCERRAAVFRPFTGAWTPKWTSHFRTTRGTFEFLCASRSARGTSERLASSKQWPTRTLL